MNYDPVFHLLVCPSDSFPGISSLDFSETLHDIRGTRSDAYVELYIFLKN